MLVALAISHLLMPTALTLQDLHYLCLWLKVSNYKLFTTERRSTKQARLGFMIDSVLIKREA